MLFTVKVAVCATVLLSVTFSLLAEDQIELPTSTDRPRFDFEKHQRLLNLLKETKKITNEDQDRPISFDFGKWNSEYTKKQIEESHSNHIDWPNFDELRKQSEETQRKMKEYEQWSKIDWKAFTMGPITNDQDTYNFNRNHNNFPVGLFRLGYILAILICSIIALVKVCKNRGCCCFKKKESAANSDAAVSDLQNETEGNHEYRKLENV